MFASSWLRKVSNTCSSHARRNGFNEIDNGSLPNITKAGTPISPGACPWVTRMCLLSGRRVLGGPGFQAAGAFPHCAHHAERLASAERVRAEMRRKGERRYRIIMKREAQFSNNVRKSALGIVATLNHMSVNAQTDNRHVRNHRTPTESAGRTWRHCRRRLRRDRATHFARAARAAERSLRSRAPRD
jgi:hypothetical protein